MTVPWAKRYFELLDATRQRRLLKLGMAGRKLAMQKRILRTAERAEKEWRES